MLTHSLNRMRRPLRGESGKSRSDFPTTSETALSMAVALGAAGLAVVGAAFIFTLRTLRPLGGPAYARAAGGREAITPSARA